MTPPRARDEETSYAPDSGAPEPPGSRVLLRRFLILLGVDVFAVLCLAARSEGNESYIDFVLYAAIGAAVGYFAFRAVLLFPFNFSELLAIVVVLSLGLRATVGWLQAASNLGLIDGDVNDPRRIGRLFLACLIVGSMLLTGAALGLRHCYYLRLTESRWRMLSIVSGMFFLPAAAGTAAFPILIVYETMRTFDHNNKSVAALVGLYVILWLFCMAISAVNIAYMIQTMTLRAESESRPPG